MSALDWQPQTSYMIPARTSCGRYQVVRRVGGSAGPTYRAQHIAGVGIAGDLGEPRNSVTEAQADAQLHSEEVSRQQAAAARSPV